MMGEAVSFGWKKKSVRDKSFKLKFKDPTEIKAEEEEEGEASPSCRLTAVTRSHNYFLDEQNMENKGIK